MRAKVFSFCDLPRKGYSSLSLSCLSRESACWTLWDSNHSLTLAPCFLHTNSLKSAHFPSHLLPVVVEPGVVAGKLQKPFFGIPVGTPVAVALGDYQCSVLSSTSQLSDAGTYTVRWIGQWSHTCLLWDLTWAKFWSLKCNLPKLVSCWEHLPWSDKLARVAHGFPAWVLVLYIVWATIRLVRLKYWATPGC